MNYHILAAAIYLADKYEKFHKGMSRHERLPKLRGPESMLTWLAPAGILVAIIVVTLLTVTSDNGNTALRVVLRIIAAFIAIGYAYALVSIGVISSQNNIA